MMFLSHFFYLFVGGASLRLVKASISGNTCNSNGGPPSDMWKFPSDSSVVVTGGTKGIGLAIVEEMAAFPNVRVLTCARNRDQLEKCLDRWRLAGYDNIVGCVADVSTPGGRDTLVTHIKKWLGAGKTLDVLVNNVGSNIRKVKLNIERMQFYYPYMSRT